MKPKAKTKGKSRNIPLIANVLTAQALDQDLTLTTNLAGLSAFQQQGRGTIPPRNGESRYLVPASELPVEVLTDGELCRSCIELADGTRILEAPRDPQRQAHTISDCGAVGFTQALWTHTRGQVHGSHSSDVYAHDSNNSIKRACHRTFAREGAQQVVAVSEAENRTPIRNHILIMRSPPGCSTPL